MSGLKFPARQYYRDSQVTIWHGNALALPVTDESVDLIVTSPPYFAQRSYKDGGEHYSGQIGSEPTPTEFLDALIAATREMMRALKPSGSIFVNLGDKYALKSLMLIPERFRIRCVDELGLIARAVLVWSKPNGLPESVTDRVRRSHEDWVHLTKAPRYYCAIDEIREAHAYPGDTNRVTGSKYEDGSTGKLTSGIRALNPLGKLPGSVWSIPTQPLKVPAELGIDHFAAFPMEWPRRLILGWAPVGGTVLDPFAGTGTTGVVAKVLARRAILVDLSWDYCRLAEWRINDPKQLARAERGQKPGKT